jgi:hypothetical protein
MFGGGPNRRFVGEMIPGGEAAAVVFHSFSPAQ